MKNDSLFSVSPDVKAMARRLTKIRQEIQRQDHGEGGAADYADNTDKGRVAGRDSSPERSCSRKISEFGAPCAPLLVAPHFADSLIH
ncbi:hypothetical protein SBV1_410054 [Verrucomicrobia bacterium]|nr:hypothetical protein SBV1_410054 [Verrucomicrobiota bacterium]